ncbi:MAG: ArnT family glycosyltransferase [Candidatus Promineifilaceae bacterium]
MSERLLLTLILLATALIGWSYAVANPVFEGGDELWHYPMVQHLSEGNPLPVQVFDPAEAGPWKQQASQPPLYYYFGAWLTGWIDSSDMPEIRWQNPHVNNGIIASDGNINLTIHNPDWNPFWGTLLAVRLIRFVSVLMGVVTVYFTYRIGKYAAPQRSEVALGAAAIVAFLPMRLFVSAAVNNDNGIIMLATMAVFSLVRFVALADAEQTTSAVYRQVTLIGITIGLACLTKIIGVGLLPLAFGALFLGNWKASVRESDFVRRMSVVFGRTLVQTTLVALITFAIAGWWYIRNVQLYDDWRGWSAFIAVLGQRSQPASLAQLWDERFGFMMAYWGLFGGVNVPLPIGVYHFLNTITVLGVFGFSGYLLQQLVQYGRKPQETNNRAVAIRILTHVLDFAVRHATIVICFVWMVAVVAGLIAWATTTWSSQGRLVFGALQAEVVLLTLGLIGWMEGRVVRFGRILIITLATFLFLVAAAAPFFIIRPAYAITTSSTTTTAPLATFGDSIALLATLPDYPKAIAAGDEFEVCLDWLILKEIERNWSVFVHLNDPILNNPISQRDMYLAQGLLGTSFAKPGTTIHNCYLLQVDPTAIGPVDLTLDVGLYDFATFERLPTETGAGHHTLDTITLQSIPTDERRAPRANFGDEIKLVDFEINSRRVERNDTLNLTLHLSALAELNTDYSVTAQIVSEALSDTTRWAASDLGLASSNWQPDELQSIQLQLPINPETPAGVYRLILGVYTQTDEGFRNLSLISADGRITNDNLLTLTKLRIDE